MGKRNHLFQETAGGYEVSPSHIFYLNSHTLYLGGAAIPSLILKVK